MVGGDRRIPSYGGDYRYAREDKGVEVQLLLFESRGSRGGYPLAALGSEDWCDAIHAGVFSGGRPSVHGVAPSPTAPASSRVSRE